MPRKSRMRGIAMLTRRSRNSYMRSPRSVTLQPIAWPSRTLNVATDFFAFVTAGFWPVIFAISAVAASMSFFLSSGTICSLKIFLSLAAINYSLFRVDHFFVRLEHAHLAAVLQGLEAD